MKSAKFVARSVRVLLAGTVSALVLASAPTTAQAAAYSGGEYCVMSSWTLDYAEKDIIDMCQPGTSGLFPIFNQNLVRPLLNMLNGYFGNNAVGGPVTAYRERRMGGDAMRGAEQLARAVNGDPVSAVFGGPGMAAGYTPTETTGEWLQRHVQPLRDHHVNSWFNTTWSNPSDGFHFTDYDSDVWTMTLGADLPLLDDKLIVGAFGSFTHSDVDTNFNSGGVDSKLGTMGPYVMYTLNEYVAFDMTFAGVFGQHENKVGPHPTARGDQDTSGLFLSANVNANYWVGNYGVQGRVGLMHSYMDTDHYDLSVGGMSVEIPGTDNNLTQLSLMTQFNYFYDQGLPFFEKVMAMPYVRLTANFDVARDRIRMPAAVQDHPNDREEVIIGWGVSLFGDGPFSGSVETGYTAARESFASWTVSGTLNYAF